MTHEDDTNPEQLDDELDFEWGGDGSDLNQPVHAHVAAVLQPHTADYAPPLDQLLRIGSPHEKPNTAAKIAQIGFTQEHVPDLVRMTRDRALQLAKGDTDESWAPIHALAALERLDVGEHVADLMPLFDLDSEWFGEGLPDVLKHAGASVLEPLRAYVQDTTRWIYGRTYALSTFSELVKLQPELRDQAIQILGETLTRASENDPYVNADIIHELTHLQAVEALPVIQQAFEQDLVDESVMGGWTEVLEALGQPPDPADPLVARERERWGAQLQPRLSSPSGGVSPAPSRKPGKAAKQKNKRKMSATSRKTNKKKKRK
ncbi:MAG: DUF1186 domain-containing protein [Kouleothrix sp.]|nr:DUF1186 domain-containing protein [Kouleothrix sp.]